MSDSYSDDHSHGRNYQGQNPYTADHPIPTVQRYREELKKREANEANDNAQAISLNETPRDDGPGAGEAGAGGRTITDNQDYGQQYPQYPQQSEDRRESWVDVHKPGNTGVPTPADTDEEEQSQPQADFKEGKEPKQRKVIDPVTHYPIMIHDTTEAEVKALPDPRNKKEEKMHDTPGDSEGRHLTLHELVERELKSGFAAEDDKERAEYEITLLVGAVAGLAGAVTVIIFCDALGFSRIWSVQLAGLMGVGAAYVASQAMVVKIRRVNDLARKQASQSTISKEKMDFPPETPLWLNSFLESVWPLINPGLFTGVADTLEDVMQASLPGIVSMVRVATIGQGSEPIRFLGIKWIRDGDAGVAKYGMEAEDGDFINLEMAIAYNARPSGKGLDGKSKNAHLMLEFYMLRGGVVLPIWVELRALLGTVRIRLQLTPDPPFFSLCTFTFLGQPKARISCVPLSKHAPNLVNLPLISGFVESSINAAFAEYVAPKSMSLDLKEMMMGEGFKWDTSAVGVIVVRIIGATDLKQGDSKLKQNATKVVKSMIPGAGGDVGGGDNYVTLSWVKMNKPLWSSRIIQATRDPNWDETAYILVTPMEMNAEEKLKLTVWESDRMTADDFTGALEIDLQEFLRKDGMRGKLFYRRDGLHGMDKDDPMPGQIRWEVGYFPKTNVYDLARTQEERDDIERTKEVSARETERKMREMDFSVEDARKELEQQKKQDLEERFTKRIASLPPQTDYLTGILSIQIHQISGLEIQKPNKSQTPDDDEEEEEGSGLPSSYCAIIVNHKRVYKTRTKPQTANPFFNAGTEQFLRNWKTSEVMVSVRDQRGHENDPIIGVVVLPLERLFKERSQICDFFPLAGGIGIGRAKISLVFHSIKVDIPKNLLGWDIGTLVVSSTITGHDLPEGFSSYRIRTYSVAEKKGGKGKYTSTDGQQLAWNTSGEKDVHMALSSRYADPVVFEFRKSVPGPDSTPALAVFWPKDIRDDTWESISLPVYTYTSEFFHELKNGQWRAPDDENIRDKQIGVINMDVRFFSGLSGYHARIATAKMRSVMEALDAAEDTDLIDRGEIDIDVGTSSSDESSSADETTEDVKKQRTDLSQSGERSTKQQIQEYKLNKKQLHRRHRGLMQWKGTRTINWMKDGVVDAKEKIKDAVHGKTRGKGGMDVETEV